MYGVCVLSMLVEAEDSLLSSSSLIPPCRVFPEARFYIVQAGPYSLCNQDDLELVILLCLRPENWEYRHGPPCQGCAILVIEPSLMHVRQALHQLRYVF